MSELPSPRPLLLPLSTKNDSITKQKQSSKYANHTNRTICNTNVRSLTSCILSSLPIKTSSNSSTKHNSDVAHQSNAYIARRRIILQLMHMYNITTHTHVGIQYNARTHIGVANTPFALLHQGNPWRKQNRLLYNRFSSCSWKQSGVPIIGEVFCYVSFIVHEIVQQNFFNDCITRLKCSTGLKLPEVMPVIP